MTASHQPYTTYVTHPAIAPFPARPSVPVRRSAWSLGLIVLGWVTAGGTALGALVGVLFGVVLFSPLLVVMGAMVGIAAGFIAGLAVGAVVAVVVGAVRATSSGTVTR